jgi:hypothetical protein
VAEAFILKKKKKKEKEKERNKQTQSKYSASRVYTRALHIGTCAFEKPFDTKKFLKKFRAKATNRAKNKYYQIFKKLAGIIDILQSQPQYLTTIGVLHLHATPHQ